MTSNIGSGIIQKNFENLDEENMQGVVETTKLEVMEELKKTLRPEFLNRIDETIMFKPLMKEQIRDIVQLQVQELEKMLADNGISIELTDAAIDELGEKGYDPQYGARPLKRVMQKTLSNELSGKILRGDVQRDSVIEIDYQNGDFRFTNKVTEEPAS